MRAPVVAMVLTALLVASREAGSEFDDETVTPSQDGPSGSLEGLGRPPDLIVTAGDEQLVLVPYTYCWRVGNRGVCADGEPPDPSASLTLETGSDLAVEFPLRWEIQASLLPNGDYCDGSVVVDVDPGGSSVDMLGPAGMYLVEVFGRGEQGDAAWSFELVTAEDRPRPPEYLQTFWFPGDRALEASAPFYARLGNLTDKPNNVSAVVTVTASDGNSQDFPMIGEVAACWGSTIGLAGPEDFTHSVLGLGPPPYEVVTSVNLDDRSVVGQAITWPDDYPSNSNESRRAELQSASH